MNDKPQTDAEQRETLDKLIDSTRFAMFTTRDEGGKLVSRPMTVQKREDARFLFISQRDTDVAQQADGQAVNLAFVTGGNYVSVSGTGSVLDDVAQKKELWNAMNDAFADGGPEDPNNVIVAVDADGAEYWDTPNGVVTLLGAVKAAVAGGRPAGGDHGTVNL
ncbi:pyridoxamine 5'-phosphate oxidase family protein [Nigerium massiliense]|uniref:pyridoxamine 5'-phosphate oxidase family protein n=1 Tax=Nigerium massiliense TaxID=1522317 RepID=UPI00058C6A73|nr:pyridoxamine 5'-phosphate oxidase family protein [Nigerium massiliense]